MQLRESNLALNPRADITKVQNTVISVPTKRTDVLYKFLKNLAPSTDAENVSNVNCTNCLGYKT